MAEKHVPIAIANAQASMRECHVPAPIIHRSARARAEEVDEELLFAHDAIFTAMRPEAPELRIAPEPRQKIVRYSCDSLISAKTLVRVFVPSLIVSSSSPWMPIGISGYRILQPSVSGHRDPLRLN
jgi:hypothetical protein